MTAREEIELLDVRVAQLKIEYEQYFMKIIRQEPLKHRTGIEKVIRRLTATHIANTGDKFKLNSIVSKFNAYRQYWNRILRMIEEGTYVRHAESGGLVRTPEPTLPKVKEGSKRRSANGGEAIDDVYKQYVEARKKCNESVDGLSVEKLQRSIAAQKKKIEEKFGTSNVDIKVSIKNGSARMSIVPKK